jgi:hypothetical protein
MVGFLVAKSNKNEDILFNKEGENEDQSIDKSSNKLEKLNLNVENNSDGDNSDNSDGFILIKEDNYVVIENQ